MDDYAIWASSYDVEKNPLVMTEEPRVRALLASLPPPARVLDVATGTGRWALYMARQGARVEAVDQSAEMLAVAREKTGLEGLPISFHEVTVEAGFPFPADHFDLVICALALSHIPDLAGTVAECGRVLRPGGYLLISDFHPQAMKNGWEPTIFRGDDAYILPHAGHSVAAYVAAVEASGCEVVHREEILVREQPRESILADDIEGFLAQYGHWPMCLILLGRKRLTHHQAALDPTGATSRRDPSGHRSTRR